MAEHRIRLRGGWECLPDGLPEAAASRLTLPTRWPRDAPGRLGLIRRFNQPYLESGTRMVLLMEQVPGIRRIFLDGQLIHWDSPERSEYEVTLGGTPGRHELFLEMETPSPGEATAPGPEWGLIALVIRADTP